MCDILMLNFVIYYNGIRSRISGRVVVQPDSQDKRNDLLCPCWLAAANDSPHQTHFLSDALPVAGSGQNLTPQRCGQKSSIHLTRKFQEKCKHNTAIK